MITTLSRLLYKLFLLFFSLLIFIGIAKGCRVATEGFSVSRILPPKHLMVHKTQGLIPASQEEILSILDQPFTYLGSGGQFYAFISRDQKTVLKFFKYHHLKAPLWKRFVPNNRFMKKNYAQMVEKKEKVKNLLFSSLDIVKSFFKEESGLIYLHLERSTHLKRSLVFYDKIGIRHELSADSTTFILQKKAIPASIYIKNLIQDQKRTEAQKAIDDLLRFSIARSKKGIRDLDFKFRSNLGFFEGKPMQIDLGSLCQDPQGPLFEIYEKDILTAHHKFKKWLHKNTPDIADYFQTSCHHLELLNAE